MCGLRQMSVEGRMTGITKDINHCVAYHSVTIKFLNIY